MRHGQGVYTYAETGTKYYGVWRDGRRMDDGIVFAAGVDNGLPAAADTATAVADTAVIPVADAIVAPAAFDAADGVKILGKQKIKVS